MKFLYKLSTIIATLAIIAGLSFSTSYAQTTKKKANNAKTYTLSGKVVNGQNQAVVDAKITIFSGSITIQSMSDHSDSPTTVTNKNGRFKIEDIASGTYTVKVEASGYKTAREQIRITEDESLTITLEPLQQ